MRENINDIIESVIRERLAGTEIIEVRVREDEGFDGDKVFRVMVIFDATKGNPDVHRITGLARHLRSKLEEEDAFSYPVFRFISQADAKKLNAAAA